MDATKEVIDGYCYKMSELRRIAVDELPESVADFLEVLTVRAHIALGSTAYQNQAKEEQRTQYKDD
jgi:hypothetical protein